MPTGLSQEVITQINRWIPYLSYSDQGELLVTGIKARTLIEEHGTPLILYLEERLLDNYHSIHQAFANYFNYVNTFFALKTCYLSSCVQALKRAGANIEVMSDIELQIAQQNGFRPEQIVANGIGRSQSYLERSLSYPVGLTIIDGIEDLMALQLMAKEKGLIADIGLRVTPPSRVTGLMVGQSAKVGMDWEGKIFISVLRAALQMQEVHVKAILIHQLSHCKSVSQYAAVLGAATKVIREISDETGHNFDIIDLGGGLDTRFLLEQSGTTIHDFAKEAKQQLSSVPYDFVLHLEPGRYITADAAIAMTRVMAEKHNAHASWRICDISSNILIPLPDIAYPPLPTSVPAEGTWQTYQVGDATLAPSLICADAILPTGRAGRELVLLNCGAYTTVFAELWAFPLPVILYLGNQGIEYLFGKQQFIRMMREYYGYKIQL